MYLILGPNWKTQTANLKHTQFTRPPASKQYTQANWNYILNWSTYQMLFRMKNNWIKMQPKGNTPPMIIPGPALV